MATTATPQRDVPRYANREDDQPHDEEEIEEQIDEGYDDDDDAGDAHEPTYDHQPSLLPGVTQNNNNSPLAAAAAVQNEMMRTPPPNRSRPGTAPSPFATQLRLPSTPITAATGTAGTVGATGHSHLLSPPMASHSQNQVPFQPHPAASPIPHAAHLHHSPLQQQQRTVNRSSKSKTESQSRSGDEGTDGEHGNDAQLDSRRGGNGRNRVASPAPPTRSEVSLSGTRPQPAVPASPAREREHKEIKTNNNNTTAAAAAAADNANNETSVASPSRPRKNIYPFSPKKARRSDVLQYPHPVVDYDEEQARHTPPVKPLIPNAWQLDFFRIFSIMVGILILLPTVFHTKRHGQYDGTAYATWQTVAMALQIIGGAILILTIISVSFAPTVYTRTIIIGYVNALFLWFAAGAFDLSRVQQYNDELIIWALCLEFLGLTAVYITVMILLYRGITGTARHVPTALSAFERKELEIARAVINDLEDEKERQSRKLTEVRQHWQGIAQTKQAIIEAKDQKLEDAMRAISELQSRCASLGERLQLLDPAAQKRQLLDARQELLLVKDQSDEVTSQLRRENGKLQEQVDQSLRNQQQLMNNIDALAKRLSDSNAKYESQLAANAQLEREKAALLAHFDGSEETWKIKLAQVDDERKKQAHAAANCAQCRRWEEKCDHLTKSSMDAAKHAERNIQLKKRVESLKKQLAVLRRATALQHDFARSTAAAVDDQVRDFRDFATTLHRTLPIDVTASTTSSLSLTSPLRASTTSAPR